MVEKLLIKAVQEVLEVVKETVIEYQEKTARTKREPESTEKATCALGEVIIAKQWYKTIGLILRASLLIKSG